MLEYMVACKDDLMDLVERVNALLAEGWRPEGGVFIMNWHAECHCYYQALVRVRPEPEAE